MTRIAVDAMGGDHAPFEIVAGAVWAAAEYGVALELVGKQDRIEHCLEVIQKEGFLSDCGKAGRKADFWVFRFFAPQGVCHLSRTFRACKQIHNRQKKSSHFAKGRPRQLSRQTTYQENFPRSLKQYRY